MKLLTAIFSYNRYYLLKNAVESFFEFGPESDLLVVDDGSDDPRIMEYLESLRNQGRAVIIIRDRHMNDFHGGLYENMNLAVDHAVAGKYSHIFFLQDDVQFMWKDIDFHERVTKVFETLDDAAMVSTFFYKKIMNASIMERIEQHGSASCWHVTPYGIVDQGIMPVKLLVEKKWRFGKSEGMNGKTWRDWGYKLYLLSAPISALIPWTKAKFYTKASSDERMPRKKYFLKPLSEKDIDKLKSMTLSEIPFHEDFCLPWGWRCISPYWFTRGIREYIKLLLKGICSGRLSLPKIVTTT